MNRFVSFGWASCATLALFACMSGPLRADAPAAPPAAPTQNVAAAQEWPTLSGVLPNGEFGVRYMVFTTKPKTTAPAAVKDPKYLPPFFEDMADGTDLTMGPSPEGFLGTLRKVDPTMDFKLILAGHTNSKDGVASIDSGIPHPNDSFKVKVLDKISLSPKVGKEAGTFDAKHEGATYYVETINGKEAPFSDGWNGVAENIVGKTYHMGGGLHSDGSLLIYAYCILR